MKTCMIPLLAVLFAGSAAAGETKSLIDYFLPMKPRGELVSEGIWGDPNVLPRDIKNGLENPKIEKWCYRDGRVMAKRILR